MVNEFGCLRWSKIRSAYWMGLIDINDIVDIYKKWKNAAEYAMLKGTRQIDTPSLTPEGPGLSTTHSCYVFIKAAKRGNDVYQRMVTQKFAALDGIEPQVFFDREWKVKSTNLLFVTLTYGHKACNACRKHFKKSLHVCPYCGSVDIYRVTVDEAWGNVGIDFNRFTSNLKKKYGKISIFRTWESHDNFYPHVHAAIFFHDHDFPVFVQKVVNKKGKLVTKYRVPKDDNDRIRGYWDSPNVDVQGVANTQDAIREVEKYITKDLCSVKGNKTAAMLSFFGKQSYAISQDFVAAVGGSAEIDKKLRQDENALLLNNYYNSNPSITKYEFIGMLPAKMLGMSGDIMSFELDKPPPELQKLINYEHKCYLAKSGRR